MSPSIWTRCGGASRLAPLSSRPWRAVDGRHEIATRALVDSDEEHDVLDAVLDAGELPQAGGVRLHDLLSAPFRQPPLRHGSRFGSADERGIWYGAESPRTAFAELAYYRLLFLEGSAADLGAVRADVSLLRAHVRTARGADLTAGAFARHRRTIASPTSYQATQRLGRELRAAGVEAFRYPSARDRESGVGVAVLAPGAFSRALPDPPELWHCVATRDAVEIRKRDVFRRETFRFPRERFLVAGALPAPAP